MSTRVRSAGREAVGWLVGVTPSPSVPELLGLAVAATSLGYFGGRVGWLAAAAVVGVWVVLPVEYVFTAGQVALVVVAPDRVGLELLLAVEAGLYLLIADSVRKVATSSASNAVWLLAAVGLSAGVWVTVTGGADLWQVALALWVGVAVAAYGLHRHELVSLGLTEGGRQS